MNLIRRDNAPLSPYRSTLDEPFGRLFENMFEGFFAPLMSSSLLQQDAGLPVSPRVDLNETDTAFQVQAELPGVKKEDIKVSIDNRRVSIEAESKRESAEKEGENIVYTERSSRKFARSFTLPTEVDDAAAEAKLENGILFLTLPKKESTHARRLTIQ